MSFTQEPAASATPVRLFTISQSRYLLLEIAAMLTGTVICFALSLTENFEAVNYIAPATIIVVGGLANIHMVLRDSRTILTPLFGLRLIALVVFGIGSILHNVISPAVQTSMDYM
nr:hypothetical protein [Sphingomonas sp.]